MPWSLPGPKPGFGMVVAVLLVVVLYNRKELKTEEALCSTV